MSNLNQNQNISNINGIRNPEEEQICKNIQNNNIPLSFNEKTNSIRKSNLNNQNNVIVFGERGVDKSFISTFEQDDNKQNNMNKSNNKNVVIKSIKESFKSGKAEQNNKENTFLMSSKMKKENIEKSKNNNQTIAIRESSKLAKVPNPFYSGKNINIFNQSKMNKTKDKLKNPQIVANNNNIQNQNNFPYNDNKNINQNLAIISNDINTNLINQNNNIKEIQPNQIQNPNKEVINMQQNNNNIIINNMNKNSNNMNNNTNNKSNNNYEPYNFNRYKKVSLCGLQNLGNTSYLNSVLQFICSIRQVASYFVNPKNGNFFEKNVDKYPLSYVMHRLCFHLYPYPELDYKEIYKPDSIMQILGLYNVIYQDYGEKNPNEFILFLLNKLHEELNAIKIKNESNVNFDKIKDDKNAIINNGMKNFINNNNSIISNYFVWFEIKNIHCIKCSKDIYSFNNFPTFELNIIEIAKVKNIQNVKIEDCLEFYELNKLQKTFCSSCKNYEQLTSRNKIYSSPNFFLFLLDLKENKNINFIIEPRINLEKFIENKTTPTKYELNGIVFFDLNKNKYNALCISPVDKRWYLFDDKNVDLFDFNDFNNFYVKNKKYIPRILLYNGSIKK